MKTRTIVKKTLFIVILAGVVIAPLIWWGFFGNTPGITPEKALRLLEAPQSRAVLVDVRSPAEFEQIRLKQAVNVPLDSILAGPDTPWTALLSGRTPVLVICNSGISSALAVKQLNRNGFKDVLNVTGGMDGWRVRNSRGSHGTIARIVTPGGERDAVPRIRYSPFEQLLICAAAFGIKPLYELVSLVLVILLWRRSAPDLTALRRAMIAFFLGENACTVNFPFFSEQNLLLEYFHMYGMLICFGLAWYALAKAVDIRMIRFSEPDAKCALLPLCTSCYKYRKVSCNIRLVFLFVIPATALISLMPLTASIHSYFFIGKILFNDAVLGHSAAYQYLELRLWPLVALVLFAASFAVLFFQKEKGFEASKILFCAGLGPISFSLMRFLLFFGYARNPLWADAWEEITEFLFIAFAAWIVFRIRSVTRAAP